MRFIEHALSLPVQYIAALLQIDFDSAITRQHLFRHCPSFAGKIVLLSRLRWIPGSTGSPSTNHVDAAQGRGEVKSLWTQKWCSQLEHHSEYHRHRARRQGYTEAHGFSGTAPTSRRR